MAAFDEPIISVLVVVLPAPTLARELSIAGCLGFDFPIEFPSCCPAVLASQVSAGADEQNVLEQTHAIFKDVGISDLAVQIESMA